MSSRSRAETAYIGLGANLGDVRAAFDRAFAAIAVLPTTSLRRASSLYRTAPIDSGGPDYLNAVIEIQTRLGPLSLLKHLQHLENGEGRERPYRNAPRTLDLDLLLYGEHQIATPRLVVPHPRLHERAFVLLPLAEVAPSLSIPGHGAVGALLPLVAHQQIVRLEEPGSSGLATA